MFHMHVNMFENTSENHLSRPVVLILAGFRESPSPFELWFLLFAGKNILFSQVGTACSSKGYIPLKREAS